MQRSSNSNSNSSGMFGLDDFCYHLDKMARSLGKSLPVHAALSIDNFLEAASASADTATPTDFRLGEDSRSSISSSIVRRKMKMLLGSCSEGEKKWVGEFAPYLRELLQAPPSLGVDNGIDNNNANTKAITRGRSEYSSQIGLLPIIPPPHFVAAPPMLAKIRGKERLDLEPAIEFKSLSHSDIWSRQSAYYKKRNIGAWISDIPCQISSNKFVSAQLLNHIFDRLDSMHNHNEIGSGNNSINVDVSKNGNARLTRQRGRALIFEIGGGHGILSLQLARDLYFRSRNRDQDLALEGVEVTVVCSDMHDGVFQELLKLPWVVHLCSMGYLNFAVMEANPNPSLVDCAPSGNSSGVNSYQENYCKTKNGLAFNMHDSKDFDKVDSVASSAQTPVNLLYHSGINSFDHCIPQLTSLFDPLLPWDAVFICANYALDSFPSDIYYLPKRRVSGTCGDIASWYQIGTIEGEKGIGSRVGQQRFAAKTQPVVATNNSILHESMADLANASISAALVVPVSLGPLLSRIAMSGCSNVELIASDYFMSPYDSKWSFPDLDMNTNIPPSPTSPQSTLRDTTLSPTSPETPSRHTLLLLDPDIEDSIPFISPLSNVAALPVTVLAVDALFQQAFPPNSNPRGDDALTKSGSPPRLSSVVGTTFLPTTSFGTVVFRSNLNINNCSPSSILPITNARRRVGDITSLTHASGFCPVGANDFQVLRDFIELYHQSTPHRTHRSTDISIQFLIFFIRDVGCYDFQVFIDLRLMILELLRSSSSSRLRFMVPVHTAEDSLLSGTRNSSNCCKRKLDEVYASNDFTTNEYLPPSCCNSSESDLFDVLELSILSFVRGNSFIAFGRLDYFSPSLDLLHGRVMWLQWAQALIHATSTTASTPMSVSSVHIAPAAVLFMCLAFVTRRFLVAYSGGTVSWGSLLSKEVGKTHPTNYVVFSIVSVVEELGDSFELLDGLIAALDTHLQQTKSFTGEHDWLGLSGKQCGQGMDHMNDSAENRDVFENPLELMVQIVRGARRLHAKNINYSSSDNDGDAEVIIVGDPDSDILIFSLSECLLLAHVLLKLRLAACAFRVLDKCGYTTEECHSNNGGSGSGCFVQGKGIFSRLPFEKVIESRRGAGYYEKKIQAVFNKIRELRGY